MTGFVLYQFFLRSGKGDDITREIVSKLRVVPNERDTAQLAGLSPSALARLLDHDSTLRGAVNQQDYELLKDAIQKQYLTGIFVYGLCAVLFLAGVGLFVWTIVRPHPVEISDLVLGRADLNGSPIDLRSLRVSWTSQGDPVPVSVSLENVETNARTTPISVPSQDGSLVFQPDRFSQILLRRDAGADNQLRAVVQSRRSTFTSPATAVKVGVTIEAIKFDDTRIRIVPLIDNSIIPNYSFEAKLLVWTKGANPKPVTFGGKMIAGTSDTIHLDRQRSFDWSTAKLTYFGPGSANNVVLALDGF